MKRTLVRIAMAFAMVLLFAVCALPLGAFAGSIARVAITDDFSGSSIDASKWLTAGEDAQKIAAVETDGALVMTPVQGYSHSIVNNADKDNPGKTCLFENGTSYEISFDLSLRTTGEAWCAVLLGAKDVGATYSKNTENGIIISASGSQSWVTNYQGSETPVNGNKYFEGLRNDGVAKSFKLTLTYEDGGYTGKIEVNEQEIGLEIRGVAGALGFQANGDGSVVKVMNLRVKDLDADEYVIEEDFSDPASVDASAERTGDWLAQNEQYAAGIGHAVKFDAVSAGVMAAKAEVAESEGNVNLFDFSFGVEIESLSEGYGFGVRTGMDGSGAGGDFLAFAPAAEPGLYDLAILRSGGDLQTVKSSVSVPAGVTVRLVGRYNGDLQVFVDETFVETVRNVSLAGYLGFAAAPLETGAEGSVSAYLYSAELTLYTFASPSAGAVSNNFNALRNGSETAGYIDPDKWVAEGNCSVRNGVLKFSAGDVNTSFNTKEKYQDFILRFDITRILGSFYRDDAENPQYATPGYYADMSIGISVGKQEYDESSIGGTHPSIQFCTKYWNKNEQGLLIPNMIIWGYGASTADGAEAAWPEECWWHDGSDGRVVTGTDERQINVVVIVKNRTISIYYKYSDQDASYLDTPKAVFTDVNTYGYVGISCGYNSTFDIDNLSITPLSFENYA